MSRTIPAKRSYTQTQTRSQQQEPQTIQEGNVAQLDTTTQARAGPSRAPPPQQQRQPQAGPSQPRRAPPSTQPMAGQGQRLGGPSTQTHAAATFFQPRSQQAGPRGAAGDIRIGDVLWKGDSPKTCFQGQFGSPDTSRKRVAFFDLDGVLIRDDRDAQHGFRIIFNSKAKLRELHEDGMMIVILTNQGLVDAKVAKLKDKEGKLSRVLRAFEVPALLFAATGYDWFRKPLPGMVERFETLYGAVDRDRSFFVGDAAGRMGQAPGGKSFWDHTDSDYSRCTPTCASTRLRRDVIDDERARLTRQYFENRKTVPVKAHGPDWGKRLAMQDPTDEVYPQLLPIVPDQQHPKLELVVFVGMPCIGKTTFYEHWFKPRGYVAVGHQINGNLGKMLAAIRDSIAQGKPVVVDETNGTGVERSRLIQLADELDVPVRAVVFDGDTQPGSAISMTQLALHNNIYAAHAPRDGPAPRVPCRDKAIFTAVRAVVFDGDTQPGSAISMTQLALHNNIYAAHAPRDGPAPRVPCRDKAIFTAFRDNFKQVDLKEGFAHIHHVNFIFRGSDHDRRLWGMWLERGGHERELEVPGTTQSGRGYGAHSHGNVGKGIVAGKKSGR